MNDTTDAYPLIRRIRIRFLKLWAQHTDGVDRQEAEKHVLSIGVLTHAYVFLVVVSSAIATLGLLLNSVAVIIGAMLIAPLMGPIILLGFSIAKTNIVHGILAAKSLLIGVLTALASSYVIVKLSPFIAPTAEILARTQPNLFDLLVAVLSGMAGGYAVVRREVGTVAGVAIATALMPPLATAGYGLATGNQAIFNGAFFLFLTNMIAISFSAAVMAAWYGLGNLHAPRELLWKTVVGMMVLAVLSVPLMRALNETVSRTMTNKNVESILRKEGMEKSWQLGQISTRNDNEHQLQVAALVFVPEIDPDAPKRLGQRMGEQLGKSVHLDLDQVLIGERKPLSATLPAPAPPPPAELSETEALRRYLKRFLGLPSTAVEIDAAANSLTIQVGQTYAGGLGEVMAMEKALAGNLPKWKVILIPPPTILPEIHFPKGSAELDKDALDSAAEINWALSRWKIRNVYIEGGAAGDEMRRDKALGLKRASKLAEILKSAGVECEIVARAASSEQAAEEKEAGRWKFRIAAVSIIPPKRQF